MKPGMRLYLAIILCVSLAACGGGGDNTGNGEDTTAPTAEASPPGGSTISGSRQVMITFDESMNPVSLSIGGTMAGECGTMIWSKNVHENDTLTISPTVAWPAGTGTLLIKASDLAGNPLVELSLTYTVDSTAHMVSALYSNNGSDWNDYVKKDGTDEFSASDTACTGDETGGYDACLHGGEMRVVEVTGKTSCSGLTAADALGAFNWACDGSTNPVRMVSTGLKDGKNLSDLLDFTTPGWKDNSVTVLDGGVGYFTTVTTAWWTNPVVVDNDGGYLDTAGTIYTVTNDALTPATGGYIINASSVGLVGEPGVIINGPGTGSYVVSADGFYPARDFLWVEGAVDAAGDDVGVYFEQVRFSVLRNVTAENADTGSYVSGVYFGVSSNNTLSGVTATNNTYGVYFSSSSNNTLSGVTATNNGEGVYFGSSSNNTLSGVTATNNSRGVWLYFNSNNNTLSGVTATNNTYGLVLDTASRNNTFSGVTASNNRWYGVYLYYVSNNNTLSGVTAANNGTGVYFGSSSNNNTLSGVTATNNTYGVWLSSSSDNTLSGVTASNNMWYGVYLISSSSDNTLSGVTATNGIYGVYLATSSSNNYFTGPLKVGSNTMDCYVSGGTNPGLADTTCTASGGYLSGGAGGYGIGNISDATLYNGVTLAGSFVAKVTADDTANSSDTNGTALYDGITDWSHFQNAFRGWGKDGPAFPDTDNRNKCVSGETCRIWDWSLRLGDTGDAGSPAILGVLSLPTGDDTLDHSWYSTTAAGQTDCDSEFPGSLWKATDSVCETTLLRNAVEIQGDGLGNENTLCESGETCLYTPNIGSYQGHGSLESAGAFTDGDPVTGITGVTLMKYKTNGY